MAASVTAPCFASHWTASNSSSALAAIAGSVMPPRQGVPASTPPNRLLPTRFASANQRPGSRFESFTADNGAMSDIKRSPRCSGAAAPAGDPCVCWWSRPCLADHCHELALLAQKDLIDTHLLERRLATLSAPALQITQIHRPHRAFRQPKLPGNTAGRSALAHLADTFLESLAERRFARQLVHFLDLRTAVGTPHPVQFDDHRRAVLEARQIPYLPLSDLHWLGQLPRA